MKQLNDLNREQKAKLLKLVERGQIDQSDITEETQFVETGFDWFSGLMLLMNSRRNRGQSPNFVILDDTLRTWVALTEERFLKNVIQKGENILEGIQPYNVLNLGSGVPLPEDQKE